MMVGIRGTSLLTFSLVCSLLFLCRMTCVGTGIGVGISYYLRRIRANCGSVAEFLVQRMMVAIPKVRPCPGTSNTKQNSLSCSRPCDMLLSTSGYFGACQPAQRDGSPPAAGFPAAGFGKQRPLFSLIDSIASVNIPKAVGFGRDDMPRQA